MNIIALSDNIESNISKIRLTIPLQALSNETGWQLRAKSIHNFSLKDRAWGDVFVIQRMAGNRLLRLCQKLRKERKIVIYEIDDLLTEIPNFLLNRGTEKQRRAMLEMARRCDFISTTNQRLAGHITEGRKNYFLTPNYAYPHGLGHASQTSAHPQANLVIAASDSILLEFILPALHQIQEHYGKGVRIIAIGHTGKALVDAGIDCETHAIMPQAEFMKFIMALHNPIGLLPLDKSEFSACKSPVKYFDYTVAGLVSIASDVPPYNEVIRSAETGFLAHNAPDDWFAKISSLIEQPELRQRISAAAMAEVRECHMLEHNIEGWKNALAKISISPRKNRINNEQSISFRFFLALESLIMRLRHVNRNRLSKRKHKQAEN